MTEFPATALPFDVEEILARLTRWAACESPTFDAAAVNRMMDLAARDLALLGARIDRIPGRMGLGDCVRARFPHPAGDAAPGICVMAHLDTVHPVGTLAKLPIRREGNRCYGPGILDMKGGTVISVEAIRLILAAGMQTKLPVTFLLTSDEEIGSPSTRDIIEAEAARNAYVLVPEPARPDGGVVTGRYAIARFNLKTTGRPSHAGARLAEGRSAIREMAKQIVAIEDMTTDDCTFSVGVIHGGQWVNCVSTTCEAEALSMAKRQEDLDAGVQRMLGLRSGANDVLLEVTRGVTRPVWEADAKGMALFGQARRIANAIGYDINPQSSGGGSDGNFTGAMGVATLDGLGVQGALAHTLEEHVLIDSLVPRAKLMAGLLTTLD
ncbi:M20/M25/M40 family metallo-hydrolase [Roseomonas fluvialis]|uniref:Carboxypeptidase n=1 Tax=Roseomonas fluvialis TaxID=1750527 RepID=A0ABM7Y0M4_9PROT|nr:M20/M25/M40 family metallo-hydrolase [Roseomonas fluvialis]BDG71347.1 carboxypeptidase [Roseomonas fluvialis]